MNKEVAVNSIIGEGTIFEGKFHVAGSFRIDGQYEGELTVEDHLFISPVGRLKTDTVYAKTIAVAGIFMGNIEAHEEVKLLSTGRVLGNITAPRLTMEPGVVVQGNIDIVGSKSQNAQPLVENVFSKEKPSKPKTKSSSSIEKTPKQEDVTTDIADATDTTEE